MHTALDNQCGHCGHDVNHASDWHCPSCNKDYRVVGIVPKRPGEQWLIKLSEHRRTHGWRGVKEAICGQCAYPIRDRESFNCPECGGDARAVGVKVPGQMGRLAVGGGLSTLGCVLSIVFLAGFFIGAIAVSAAIAGNAGTAFFTLMVIFVLIVLLYLFRSYRDGIRDAQQSDGSDK